MDRSTQTAIIGFPISLAVAAGLAWAGSQGGGTAFGWPLFGLCVGLSILIQWIAFIPAYLQRSERFYDLIGSFTFLTVTGLALVLGPKPDARSVLLAVLVAIWAIRLGSFLFARIHRNGSDSRFDEIKTSFARFLLAWTLQGLWVSFSAAAALAVITAVRRVDFGPWAIIGLIIWLLGFGFEVIADYQKSRFRKDPANKDRFIRTGLWAHSRHPNYFGEIVLWVGIAVIAIPVLQGWQYVTLLSPVFVATLLIKVSGIPQLEDKADQQWGGQKEYEQYKATTPILVPKL